MAHQGMTQQEVDVEGAREEGKAAALTDWHNGMPADGIAACRSGGLRHTDVDLPESIDGDEASCDAFVDAYQAKIVELADDAEG